MKENRLLFSAILLFVHSIALSAPQSLTIYDLLFMPKSNEIYMQTLFKISSIKEYQERDIFSGSRFIKTDVSEYSTVENRLENTLSFGASDILELGVDLNLALSKTKKNNNSDNGIIADDNISSGLYDPVFFGRHRYLDLNGGKSIVDIILKISPGLGGHEFDDSLNVPKPGNVKRGGSKADLSALFGHQDDIFAVILAVEIGKTTKLKSKNISNGNLLETSSQNFFKILFATQYYYTDSWSVNFKTSLKKHGETQISGSASGVLTKDAVTAYEVGMSSKLVIFDRTAFLKAGVSLYGETGSKTFTSDNNIFAHITGRQGLIISAGVEFLF